MADSEMEPVAEEPDSLAGIRLLEGVSWDWRPDAPIDRRGREAGVIAQDVRAVFPELTEVASDGYMMVDYAGLAKRVGRALSTLDERVASIEASRLSDGDAKRGLAPIPVQEALAALRRGELKTTDLTALVGTLVEAVKGLDARVERLERSEQ